MLPISIYLLIISLLCFLIHYTIKDKDYVFLYEDGILFPKRIDDTEIDKIIINSKIIKPTFGFFENYTFIYSIKDNYCVLVDKKFPTKNIKSGDNLLVKNGRFYIGKKINTKSKISIPMYYYHIGLNKYLTDIDVFNKRIDVTYEKYIGKIINNNKIKIIYEKNISN